MKTEKFEKKIKHLTQVEILSVAVSVINKILFDKGLITQEDLQRLFLNEIKMSHLTKAEVASQKKRRHRRKPATVEEIIALEEKYGVNIGRR